MTWFYLALLAPFLYAITNLLDDNLLSYVYKNPAIAATSAGFFGLLPLLSLPFLHASALPLHLALLAVSAGCLTLMVIFFYFKGLESDVPSVVVALLNLVPATIPFLAHFIVHENLSMGEIIGLAVVLVASFGLAMPNPRELKFSKALIPILCAVVFSDAVSLISKYTYQRADFYPVYMYFSVGMGLAGAGFFMASYAGSVQAAKTIKSSLGKILPVLVATELLALGAEFTINLATSKGPVSLVKVIEAIQPMFVLLIALALYPKAPKYFREAEEGHPVRKLAFMLVAVVGLALIGLASKA